MVLKDKEDSTQLAKSLEDNKAKLAKKEEKGLHMDEKYSLK